MTAKTERRDCDSGRAASVSFLTDICSEEKVVMSHILTQWEFRLSDPTRGLHAADP